jgi:flagellar basal-body rod modification protein FlgD
MSKNEFLKILAAQLQNQDPSNPTSNTEFVAQLAQFSSLEQMQNIAETINSMSIVQSAGLIGKTAVAEVDGTNVTGTVESILIQNSIPYAVIGSNYVPVSSITQIT